MIVNALTINFVRSRGMASPIGFILLIAGIVAMVSVGLDFMDAREELIRVERRQAKTKNIAAAARKPAATAASLSTEDKAVDAAGATLNLPWDALLRDIETRTGAVVALLSVDALGQSRTLRINGEAKNMTDAAAYVSRLRDSPLLRAVYLSGHEEKQAGAVSVVRFSLDAKWSAP